MKTRATLVTLLLITMLVAWLPFATAEIEVIIVDPEEATEADVIAVPKPRDSSDGKAPVSPVTDIIDEIHFMNKDTLHGKLSSISPEDYGLRWQHASVGKPIDFSLSSISHITLAPRNTADRPPKNATIRLTNDDELTGNIVLLDAEGLTLDTWYSGNVRIRRAMLKTINPNTTKSFLIYEGPTDISNWTQGRSSNRNSWKFKNGALYATHAYPIARNIDNLPDMANIQFDTTWNTSHPQFYFAFYTDNLQQYYGNCYILQVSSSSVYLQRYSRHGSQNSLGSVSVSRFNSGQTRNARFNILVNKEKRSFTLLLDGQLMKQWTDPHNFAGLGTGILFQPQSQGRLKFSNIEISQWDGRIPQEGDNEQEQKQDLIRFINNDKVSGRLQSIAEGKVKFETSYAVLDIPLARITEIHLSSETSERARRNKGDVRARFRESGTITVKLKELKEARLAGHSENFGDINLPLDAFRLLEFNIYEEKEDDKKDDFSF